MAGPCGMSKLSLPRLNQTNLILDYLCLDLEGIFFLY
jgi:hypothetical protein